MAGVRTSVIWMRSNTRWGRQTPRKSRANTSTCARGSSDWYAAHSVSPRRNRCTIWSSGSSSIGTSLGEQSDMESTDLKHLRRLLIPPALHEDIQHVIVLVDSAPEVMALPVDGQEHLVEVPFVAWLGAATLQPIRIILPKLQTPLADGLVGHVDAALEQEFLYITVAQREAIVEPDPVTDDFTGKAVVLIAVGV